MSLKATLTFKDNTPKFLGDAGKFITRAVAKSIAIMDRNIKVNTPVKEGHLRRSISNKMTSETAGEVYTAPVEGGKEVNYAIYVEYGTKYMAPRAMFRKGVEQSEDQIKQAFTDEARSVLK